VEEWLNHTIGIDRFVRFASPEYFALAGEKETREVLSPGPEIVFSHRGKVLGQSGKSCVR